MCLALWGREKVSYKKFKVISSEGAFRVVGSGQYIFPDSTSIYLVFRLCAYSECMEDN